MPPPNSSSFTVKANGGRLRALQTPCHVSLAFSPTNFPHPTAHEFVALWDTGATNSVITQKVIDACGVKQTGVTQVTGVNSTTIEPTFQVGIRLLNNVIFADIQVTKGKLGTEYDVLIGMDIITMGDFAITNKDGITFFSFCVPSFRRTDFVEEHHARERSQQHFQHGGGKKRQKKHKTFGKNK